MAAPPITTRKLVETLGAFRTALVSQWLRTGAVDELRELRAESAQHATRQLSVVLCDELAELDATGAAVDTGDGDDEPAELVDDDESE